MKFSFYPIGVAMVVLLNSIVLANLGRVSLWGRGISPLIDPSLWAHLAAPPSHSDEWGYGWIPQRCWEEANANSVSPYYMQVFNVHYSDCDQAWVFCRYAGAQLSQADMIDLFGRLPVHERQWVQHVIAVNGVGSAYESAAVTVYQGPVGTPSVFQHETTHALDFYKNDFQVSATSRWTQAILEDYCVPDDYSNTNEIEDFAQIGVVALFEQVNPGGLDPAFGQNWHCLINQEVTLKEYIGDALAPGGTCERRWSDSNIIPMGGPTKRAVGLGPKPAPGLQVGQPNVYAIPIAHKSAVTNYTNLSFNVTEKENAASRQAMWQAEWEAKTAMDVKAKKRSGRLARFEEMV